MWAYFSQGANPVEWYGKDEEDEKDFRHAFLLPLTHHLRSSSLSSPEAAAPPCDVQQLHCLLTG